MDADFNEVLGVVFDDAAQKTFKENHRYTEAMKLDLFDSNNIKNRRLYKRYGHRN